MDGLLFSYCTIYWRSIWGAVALRHVLCIAVCTCVVHKRCHLSVITKCPGVKDITNDEVRSQPLVVEYIQIQ
jgi:novel protein kinase C epsilon type